MRQLLRCSDTSCSWTLSEAHDREQYGLKDFGEPSELNGPFKGSPSSATHSKTPGDISSITTLSASG